MARSAKGTNRERGRPSRQENISAPRLMMAELRPPRAPLLPPPEGRGRLRVLRGLFFHLETQKTLKKMSQAIIPAGMGGGGGLLMRHFVLFSISVVFFVSTQPHTLKLSGGSRDGRYRRRPPVEPPCIFMNTSPDCCLTFM